MISFAKRKSASLVFFFVHDLLSSLLSHLPTHLLYPIPPISRLTPSAPPICICLRKKKTISILLPEPDPSLFPVHETDFPNLGKEDGKQGGKGMKRKGKQGRGKERKGKEKGKEKGAEERVEKGCGKGRARRRKGEKVRKRESVGKGRKENEN